MKRPFLFLFWVVTTINFANAQNVSTNINYDWHQVSKVKLYHSSNNQEYCAMEQLREMVKDSSFQVSCDGSKLLELIKRWNNDGPDIWLEKKCIAIVVDFNEESIPFAVFVEQAAMFDLRKSKFQYLNIPDKEEFQRVIQSCIE